MRTMATHHTNETEGWRGLERIALFLGLLVSTVPPLAFLAGRLADHFVVNSDYLLLPELLSDLASGGSVDQWVVPYASYLIPDWPLYSVALLVTPSATLAVALFAFMQSLLLFAALRRLAQVFDPERKNFLSLIGLSIITIYACLDAVPLVYLATAYTHFGTVILLIFALAFTLDWIVTQEERLVWLSVVASAAAVLSDRLFVLWFLIPAAIGIGVFTLRRRIDVRAAARWIIPHVIASVLVLPVGGLVFTNRSEYDLTLGFSDLRGGLRRFVDTLTYVSDFSITLIPVIAACVLLIGWRLWRRSSLAGRSLDPTLGGFLALYFGVAAATTATAQIMMSGDVAPGPRYSLPILVLPLVLAPTIALAGWDWSQRTGSPALAISVAPVVATLGLFVSYIPNIDLDQSPVPSTCIEAALSETGSNHGIASYWDARTVEVFSNGDLDVAPYGPLLFESHINAGLAAFGDTYDFAVTSEIYPGWNISLEALDAASGPPLSRVQCERWTVSDWGPDGLRLVVLQAAGASLAFDGCNLSSHLAESDEQCSLAVDETESSREYLVYGPYVHVEPGEFEIAVSYSSAEPQTLVVGEWDVTTDSPDETTILDTGTINGTKDVVTTLTTTIVVPQSVESTSVLQWRLVTLGSVAVSFEQMTVTRIG